MYTTYLASSFRSFGFGIKEAHGRGMALQLNYLMDKGAFAVDRRWHLRGELREDRGAVRDLTRDLLTLEATGDYAGAKQMLDSWR